MICRESLQNGVRALEVQAPRKFESAFAGDVS
jgi:hypothetical protein